MIYLLFTLLSILDVPLSRLILVPRTRSRHCSTFYPLNSFDIPINEIMYRLDKQELKTSFDSDYEVVRKENSFPGILEMKINTNMKDENQINDNKMKLIDAVKKCVLIRSVLEVISEGDTLEEAIDQIPRDINYEYSSLAVSVWNESYLKADVISELLSPCEKKMSKCVVTDKLSEAMIIKVMISNDRVIIGNELARGLAAPQFNNNWDNKWDPLSSVNSLRRPSSGILKKFSLNKLPFTLSVSMEPELALLMNSCAGVESGSKVLDPFSGSSTILLAASLLGANTTGSDIIYDNNYHVSKVLENFDYITNLAPKHFSSSIIPPTLLYGGIQELSSLMSQEDEFDCIVTDPPFGLKVKYNSSSEDDNYDFEENIYCTVNELFKLASSKHLKTNGKIVFWYCEKISKDDLKQEQEQEQKQDFEESPSQQLPNTFPTDVPRRYSFRLLGSHRQSLSTTLSRYLMVFQKE